MTNEQFTDLQRDRAKAELARLRRDNARLMQALERGVDLFYPHMPLDHFNHRKAAFVSEARAALADCRPDEGAL